MQAERADRELLVRDRWSARTGAELRKLITPELIAEHARKPLGQHSDALERVLNYFRRVPQASKYVGVCTQPWTEWRIGVLSGVRGVLPTILQDQRFASELDLQHGIFLLRIRDLMAS
jgi:branched-chain amino acid transport system permease protein